MTDRDELSRQAADPATPLRTLHRIAQERPDLRPALAANPATYPALLDWLAALGDPDVDAALAARGTGSGAPADPQQDPVGGAPEGGGPAPEQADTGPGPEETAVHPAPTGPEETAVHPAPTGPEETAVLEEVPSQGAEPTSPPRRDPGATEVLPADTTETAPASYAPIPVAPPTVPPASTPLTHDARTPASGFGAVTGTADPTGRRLMWVVLGLAALVVVVGGIWVLTMRGDDPAPQATTAPAGEETTEAGDPTEPTGPPAEDYEEARAALVALPESTTCADVGADAEVVQTFAAVAADDAAWQQPDAEDRLLETMTQLQERCGAGYAVELRDQLVGRPGTSPALVSALDGEDWIVRARPAPDGAEQRQELASPSENIACVLGEESTRCSIAERAFDDPPGCDDAAVTVVVPVTGEATVDCTAPTAEASEVLDYDQSATNGPFACTSARDGVTCWSTVSGRGFTVARAGVETF